MIDPTLVTAVLTFLGMIAGFSYQFVREGRQHRWDAETQRATAEKLQQETQAAAATVQAQVAKEASAARLNAHVATTALADMIQDNTRKGDDRSAQLAEVKTQSDQLVTNTNGTLTMLRAEVNQLRETVTLLTGLLHAKVQSPVDRRGNGPSVTPPPTDPSTPKAS